LRAVSLRVNQWLFTPGQFITRTGDLAQELYYVKFGQVVICDQFACVSIVKIYY